MKKLIYKQIVTILINYPESRNNDLLLTKLIWKTFYSGRMKQSQDGETYVRLDDIFILPREDSIKRIRCMIQNTERRYLPTDKKVLKERITKSSEWKAFIKSKYYYGSEEANIEKFITETITSVDKTIAI